MGRTSGNTIKAVVFDWDGVIVDSMPIIALSIQETAASYGVYLSVDQILATYFQPKEAFYRSIGIDLKNKGELSVRHSANDRKYLVTNSVLFSDVLSTLASLRDKDIRLGIATQRSERGMIQVHETIEANHLRKVFPSENIQNGPSIKEEKLVTLIETFRITPDELLFVGDLPSDITSAKNSGVKSAGICRHESGKARLRALNPDYFLDSLSDLLKIL